MKQNRLTTARRHWHIIALLRSCGWLTLAKLAQETGVTGRTIRRDLECLQEVGIPIVSDKDERQVEAGGAIRHWRIARGAPCPCCGHAPAYSRRLTRAEMEAKL